jgi:hypothetical protein
MSHPRSVVWTNSDGPKTETRFSIPEGIRADLVFLFS